MSQSATETNELAGVAKTKSRNALAAQCSLRVLGAFALVAGVLLLSSWTLHYWQAAAYLVAVFVPLAIVTIALLARNPAVIERRLTTVELNRSQRALIGAFRPLFILMMFVPGLDHRLRLSRTITGAVSPPVSLICDVLIVLALLFAGWVLQVNEFAGPSISVEKNHPLIATGPYSIVRHPLYSSSLVLWLATPLALGSWVALPLFVLLVPFYILRLMEEELVLTRDLRGYTAYCKRTPFRLIPWVW